MSTESLRISPVALAGGSSAEPLQPVPYRAGGFSPRRLPGAAPLSFGAVLLLWWVASTRGWVSPLALPNPVEVVQALVATAMSGDLAVNLAASLQRLAVGWSLGAGAGVVVGFAIGMSSLARSAGLPLVSALFPIPKIALLPLFILWFGIGEASKIATIGFGCFAPMVIAAFSGVDNVDRSLIRMAQSFGVPTFQIVRKIVLPGAMPALLSGARISTSIGIILLTAAEMIGAEHGIGAFVLAAGNLMQTDQLIAGVLVLATLGLAISQGIGLLEKRFLGWR